MITKIPVKKFKRVDGFEMNGRTQRSGYLNQYFKNFENGEVIHAHYTDDDNSCYYELVKDLYEVTDKNGKSYIAERTIDLGMAENWFQCIFDEDYPDVTDGFVELDTDRW